MRYSEFDVQIYYCYGAASDQKQESDTAIIGRKYQHGVGISNKTLVVLDRSTKDIPG